MRKSAILILTFIMLLSAAFIITQRKMNEENMGRYEYDKGMLGIAVSRVMTSKSVVHNFGKPIYPEDKSLQYVWVYIKLVNLGTTAVHVEPEEFTLSVPGKAAANYDLKATNSMQKRLKSIELGPNKQDIGLLIFPLSESKDYTLHYNGPYGIVEKRFVID